MRALLKDPLVHFLAAGAVIFVLASIASPPKSSDDVIIVDRPALLTFIQYRSKAFEPKTAAKILDGLDAQGRQKLIADYVREEALVREAETLGLESDDYVIRQRMVQKAEFLAEAAISPPAPSDAEVMAYFETNRERYRSPPSATFTHIFISKKNRTPEETESAAKALLAKVKANGAAFDDAPKYGDRFLFHTNYVDRTDDYIKSQIGEEATAAIFNRASPLDTWLGPYRSDYGDHLIFVASRSRSKIASFEAIKEIVRQDLMEDQKRAAVDKVIDDLVAKYRVDNRLNR
ncbi:MAG: peptidylprolyl isomerase [Parvularculaceae bacterium]